MISKVDPSRYADTGFSIADTPADLNQTLFRQMMEKTGAERLIIGCLMNDSARQLVWSGISKSLPEVNRRQIFLERFYGEEISDKVKAVFRSRRPGAGSGDGGI